MSNTSSPLSLDAPIFEKAVSDLKQGVDTATAAHVEASEKVLKTAKDLSAFNQETLNAFGQASQTLSNGSRELARAMFASNQSAFAETLSAFRAWVVAPSAKERFELQLGFARTASTWAVSESSRFAQAGIDLANEAFAPLAARASVALGNVKV